jgi:hypothetical protein
MRTGLAGYVWAIAAQAIVERIAANIGVTIDMGSAVLFERDLSMAVLRTFRASPT